MRYYIFILAFISGIFVSPVLAQTTKKKVAVYMTGDVEDSYKKVIGSKLVSQITATMDYAAVERTADFLAVLSSEQDYQTSGEVRDSQIARLGQKFGVRYVVVADVNELFDELFISSRLINVETALVEKSFEESSQVDSMDELISLSSKIAIGLLVGGHFETSEEPKHMYLCVYKNGKFLFISPDEWKIINNNRSYTKKGICLIEGKDVYIVDLKDSPAIYDHSPQVSVAKLLCKYIKELNELLPLYGGEKFHPTTKYMVRNMKFNSIWNEWYTGYIYLDEGGDCEEFFSTGILYMRKIYSFKELL